MPSRAACDARRERSSTMRMTRVRRPAHQSAQFSGGVKSDYQFRSGAGVREIARARPGRTPATASVAGDPARRSGSRVRGSQVRRSHRDAVGIGWSARALRRSGWGLPSGRQGRAGDRPVLRTRVVHRARGAPVDRCGFPPRPRPEATGWRSRARRRPAGDRTNPPRPRGRPVRTPEPACPADAGHRRPAGRRGLRSGW